MDPLVAGLLVEIAREHPSGVPTRAGVLAALSRHCNANLQFYLALRDSAEARREVKRLVGQYCTADDLAGLLGKVSLSVVAEEQKFPVGRYPQSLFIHDRAAMDAFVADAMPAPEGEAPRRPLAEARFFCVGSCFATNVAWHLSSLGARIHTTVLAESINSPRNNVDLFHYLETGERRGLLLRDDIRELAALDEVRAAFLASDTLVLTLGCAYSLVSGATGEPISRLEPGARFDGPRVATVAGQLARIVDACEARGFRDVFMTVSPVPLAGTLAHGGNAFVSDAASKAILRAALEEVLATRRVRYIPSFEVFRQGALHAHFPVMGLEDGNSRHVNTVIVGSVVRRFVDLHYVVDAPAA